MDLAGAKTSELEGQSLKIPAERYKTRPISRGLSAAACLEVAAVRRRFPDFRLAVPGRPRACGHVKLLPSGAWMRRPTPGWPSRAPTRWRRRCCSRPGAAVHWG